VVFGDLLDFESVRSALRGVQRAYLAIRFVPDCFKLPLGMILLPCRIDPPGEDAGPLRTNGSPCSRCL